MPTSEAFDALLRSDRVSANTRRALLARAADPPPGQALNPEQLATLRAVVDRVLPGAGLDLAERVDAGLAAGDGWRFAVLPADVEAYRQGLVALDGHAQAGGNRFFAALDASRQDAMLRDAAAGELASAAFDAGQMKRWFEDVRSDATRAYASHPATLARIGYTGFAYGGDGPAKPGFVSLGLGEPEPWEPA